MRCLKFKIFIVALFGFIALQEIFVDNSYALDDITFTYNDSSHSDGYYYCSSNDCSSYRYILIKNISVSDPLADYVFSFAFGSSNIRKGFSFRTVSSDYFILFPIVDPIGSYFSLVSFGTSGSWSFDLTLSENNPFTDGIIPSGSLDIVENGTYDVTNYAEAVVDVPQSSGGGSGGDYTDELNGVITAIYTCGAVVLVVYFFYCIYRMIIKTTGGK